MLQTQHAIATVIQAAARALPCRRTLSTAVGGAIEVQRAGRGLLARRSYAASRAAVVTLQAGGRSLLASMLARRVRAARQIQRICKGMLTRLALARLGTAAAVVQRIFHAKRAQRQLMHAIKFIQSMFRFLLSPSCVPQRRCILHACASLAHNPRLIPTALKACEALGTTFDLPRCAAAERTLCLFRHPGCPTVALTIDDSSSAFPLQLPASLGRSGGG